VWWTDGGAGGEKGFTSGNLFVFALERYVINTMFPSQNIFLVRPENCRLVTVELVYF
jgi:hypothetical protein